MPRRPLTGIRVVDLTIERGELCARLLSDLGAEVIRVEPPGGSPSRLLPPTNGNRSLFFAFRNAGKLGVELDLSNDDDRERLHDLLDHSDVIVDSAEPGAWTDSGLDADDLARRHPHLVCASITAYGRTGPYAGRDVPNAVIEATGGMAFKAGLPEREPLLPPGHIADDTASMTGAFAILCALRQKEAAGAGQVIDISVNESVAQITDWSLSNWTRSADAGMAPPELRAGPGPVYTIIPCLDGFVRLVIIAVRHWRAMREWLGEPDYLQDPELDTFLGRMYIADAVLNPLYGDHFANMTMEQVAAECQQRGIVCTPILKPSDVLANEHFEARGTFDDVAIHEDGPAAGTMKMASGFFEIDGERVGPTGPAPRVGQHTDEVFSTLADPRPAPLEPLVPAPPLEGMRVIDFGHGGVGVETGRMFAEYGADVVKIETRTYPDFMRVVLGGEMSPSFGSSSRSKRSMGVNAKTDRGRELLLDLIRDSDVMIENNSTGVMDAMGLGYETVAGANPDVVMMSSQLMGSWGPWASWSGYGPNTQVTGGMTHLWNYKDLDRPAGSQSIFPDHFAGRSGAVIALASVLGRDRIGDGGCHTEICQVEQVVQVMADLLAKESLDAGSVVPMGNHSERGAPWGLYRCAGDDEWVAICTRSDAEWRSLVTVMGDPDWAMSVDLDDLIGRQAREAAVDSGVGAWTAGLTKQQATEACLSGGVAAGPMLTAGGQVTDPHYQDRGFLVELFQPPIGNMTFEGAAFRATAMLGPDIRPAPALGEHTRDVVTALGRDADEIETLIAEGVLETDQTDLV